MIPLPYAPGASICPEALVGYFAVNQLGYLLIGAEQVCYDELSHDRSLDRSIRSRLPKIFRRNMKQAVRAVVDELCETGYFERFTLPPNGRPGRDPQALRGTILPEYDHVPTERAA